MKIKEGVECSCYACAVSVGLSQRVALSAAALAAFHELPAAYMPKHRQALSLAGIVRSVRGDKRDYQLARPANEISLWDIRQAIKGAAPDFQCREIRHSGPVLAVRRFFAHLLQGSASPARSATDIFASTPTTNQ
jgi:DNA-binding IscR family transcriptional regulator